MCLLCVEIAKNTMTPKEIAHAYIEMVKPDEHSTEILNVLEKEGKLDEVQGAILEIVLEQNEKEKQEEEDPFDWFYT